MGTGNWGKVPEWVPVEQLGLISPEDAIAFLEAEGELGSSRDAATEALPPHTELRQVDIGLLRPGSERWRIDDPEFERERRLAAETGLAGWMNPEMHPRESRQSESSTLWGGGEGPAGRRSEFCAWYSPMHFYGSDWGIYIREDCLRSTALDIVRVVSWQYGYLVAASIPLEDLVWGAFCFYYLHENFHHRVEALGIRLHTARQQGSYRDYKANVYRQTYWTNDCLEEALANAEALTRYGEGTYGGAITDPRVRKALKTYVGMRVAADPPGYNQAWRFKSRDLFHSGRALLAAMVADATRAPRANRGWHLSEGDMLRPLFKLDDHIYSVVAPGTAPLLPTRSGISPSPTCSSKQMIRLLTCHGYTKVPRAGKGSHTKLARPGAERPAIVPDHNELRIGTLNSLLRGIERKPADLPELLKCKPRR